MTAETELLKDIKTRMDWAFICVNNALNQLDEKQIWYRPSSQSNNVGILLQHLTGNLSQWVLDALGKHEYTRNRPLEFEDKNQRSREELIKNFSKLGRDVQDTISKVPPDSLLLPRHIQDTDQTVLTALMQAITHMELHTGQILYIAKMLLNEKYVGAKRP
jgi:hypothetical protein